MPKKDEKEGSVAENFAVDAKDQREARKDAPVVVEVERDERGNARGTDGATLVVEEPAGLSAPDLTEEEMDQGPTEPAPEEGMGDNVQVPVFTPGTLAPISSKLLPNAQRDAQLILADRADGKEDRKIEGKQSLRFDPNATGPRDARDLAILLRARPEFVNVLDQLEDYEKADGVRKPAGWVKNPVDLLEEAKRYNMFFVNEVGNMADRPSHMA